MTPVKPNFVTCPCQSCGSGIEFDANQMDASGSILGSPIGSSVQCPHCDNFTLLTLPRPAPAHPPADATPGMVACPACGALLSRQAHDCPRCGEPIRGRSTFVLNVAAAILFVVGCGLVFSGCAAELQEQSRSEGNAIHQIPIRCAVL